MTVALFRRKKWNPRRLGTSLAAWYRADAGCYTDAACRLTGASAQKLSIASTSVLNPSSAMTWFEMVKVTSVGATSVIASKGVAGDYSWGIQIEAGLIAVYVSTAANSAVGSYANGSHGLSAGDQTSVAVVFDGSGATNADRLKVYIGGVAVSLSFTGTIPATLLASAAELAIGYWDAGGYGNDVVGRAAMYSRALSAAEVLALHNSNTGVFYAALTTAQKVGLIESWNLCESSGDRVGSHAALNLTPTNGPTVAAGPGEGACVNGSPVKRWEDQSGGGNHLTQSDVTKQPIWTDAQQNGRPAVVTDGVDDCMFDGFTLVQPEDIFAAVGAVGAGASKQILDGKNDLGGDIMAVYANYTAADKVLMYAGSSLLRDATSAVADWHSYRFLFNGASSILSTDGSNATGDVGAIDGGGLTIAANAQRTANFCAAKYGELFIARTASSTPVASSALAYLKSRWATP